jgi:aromatic-L-amino-acid/L-tryptophan decarboxylase
MTSQPAILQEESLDPDDWDAARELGHRMVDDMLDYLQGIRDQPVWQPIPEDVRARFNQPLPLLPQGTEQAYRDFVQDVLPYNLGTNHPRFWGWVCGTGTVTGMLADMLAGAMNPNLGGAHHIPNYVEAQVIDWCKAMLDFPPEASGVLVSGGSMANLIGLAVARNAQATYDLRDQGIQASPRKMTIYASAEAHSSNQKSIELLGLGTQALRKIPVTDEFQVDIPALERAISEDRVAGHQPFCIIGCCGTTNTGAIDDLNCLADICARENIWFHVDGAFGALAALTPNLRSLVSGIERADSLAVDLHKWVYVQVDVGAVLIRDAEQHLRTFSLTPTYLAHDGNRGPAAGPHWFNEYSIELSRRFRALKVWLSFKEQGIEKIGRIIEQNVRQAQYLYDLIEADPFLENLSPVSLNVVNFRFRVDDKDDHALNELNEELLIRLQESGVAVPSGTEIRSKFALHVAITNHRSQREDFDLLVREVVRLGQLLL